MHLNPVLTPTAASDADLLVSIRIAAMRESLERLGRFDPQRARERFLATFDPALCHFIEAEGVRVGFCVVRPLADAWHLDHLYLLPEHQGRGLGGAMLRQILADVDALGLPIRLGALRGSRANAFYRRHGFEQVGEAEWDIYYLRPPCAHAESLDDPRNVN
ncbi:GNAT family N-acetyltransferase [Pseudomonas sp. No.117]